MTNSLVHGFTASVSKLSNISKFWWYSAVATICLSGATLLLCCGRLSCDRRELGSRALHLRTIVERILLAAILFIFVHRALLTAWRATSGNFPNYYPQPHCIIGISSSTGCTTVIGPEAGASDRLPASLVGCPLPDMVDSKLRDGKHRRDFPRDAEPGCTFKSGARQ